MNAVEILCEAHASAQRAASAARDARRTAQQAVTNAILAETQAVAAADFIAQALKMEQQPS